MTMWDVESSLDVSRIETQDLKDVTMILVL